MSFWVGYFVGSLWLTSSDTSVLNAKVAPKERLSDANFGFGTLVRRRKTQGAASLITLMCLGF